MSFVCHFSVRKKQPKSQENGQNEKKSKKVDTPRILVKVYKGLGQGQGHEAKAKA